MTPVEEGVIEPGNVWIGPAGTTYRYEAEKAWHVFWFHLAEGPRWAALAEQAVSQQKMSSLEVLRAATEGFIAESVRREPDADVAARAYAEIIGVFLDRELGKAQSAAHRRTRYQLAGLWESVNAKPAAPWTVARLADLLSVSPVHLHRLTLRHHSLTPMAMVTNLRMGRAEAMLGSNNYTLDQIAAAVGYETPFAFSRAFKRHVGQSPKMYRTERQLQKP